MKAVIWTKYGSPDGLAFQEIKKPSPNDDEILVKIHGATVTAGDCEMRRLKLPLGLSFPIRLYAGFLKPKRIPVLGQEFAGEIAEIGQNVKSLFKLGDQVFGTTGFRFGAYAEYLCMPGKPGDADGVMAVKPQNLSYVEAAAVPTAGLEALHYMRKAGVQAGKRVLIIGGGGSIGTYSIQLAKHFGAEVTGVDSTAKLDMMRALGADQVIDYTQEDYLDCNETYDLVIDVVGKHSVLKRLRLLKKNGVYFLAFARPSHILLGIWTSLTSAKRLKIESADQTEDDLLFLKNLIEAGKLKPVIDRVYPLAQVPDAHNYVESGGKKGNVCITLDPNVMN